MAPKSVSADAKWTNRTYHIAASQNDEMQTWINVLQAGSKKTKPSAKETPTKKLDSDEDNDKPTKEGNKDEASSDSEEEKKK